VAATAERDGCSEPSDTCADDYNIELGRHLMIRVNIRHKGEEVFGTKGISGGIMEDICRIQKDVALM